MGNLDNFQFSVQMENTVKKVTDLLLMDDRLVKSDKVNPKWFGLDGLKDTQETKDLKDLYYHASDLIDRCFYNAFNEGQLDSDREVVECALLNVMREVERIMAGCADTTVKYKWKLKVMVMTLLRYRDLLIRYETRSAILNQSPNYWRQYGFSKSSVEEALLYYKGTERRMKRHTKINFIYRYNLQADPIKVPIPFEKHFYMDLPYYPATYADDHYQEIKDLPRDPYPYFIFGDYDAENNAVIYDYRDIKKLGNFSRIPTDSPKKLVMIPLDTNGKMIHHLVHAYAVEPNVNYASVDIQTEKNPNDGLVHTNVNFTGMMHTLSLYTLASEEMEIELPAVHQLLQEIPELEEKRKNCSIYILERCLGEDSIIPLPYRISDDDSVDLLTEKDYNINWDKYGLDVENFDLERVTVEIPYTVGDPTIDNGFAKAMNLSVSPEVQ